MAQPGKTYNQRERRLLSEWLARTYPNARVVMNQRLGAYPLTTASPLPANIPPSALSSYRRYVDALVILPDQLVLVESKIIMSPAALAAIELYAQLLPNTPELAPYLHLPLNKVIVAAVSDPVLTQMAAAKGIEVITYTPSWVYADLMSTEFNTAPPKLKAPVPME